MLTKYIVDVLSKYENEIFETKCTDIKLHLTWIWILS